MTVILNAHSRWVCPNCPAELVVKSKLPHSPFHPCPGMRGLEAPMVPEGTKCKVEAKEREDYIGTETVTVNSEGRPIMSIETTRDDGKDVVVFAPCATTEVKGIM